MIFVISNKELSYRQSDEYRELFTFALMAMVVLMTTVVDELLDVFDEEYGYVPYFHESKISNLKNASD
jgi:hypothetical protein